MPNSFTSNEFNKRAIKNGYPAKNLKRKGLANFIRKYANNTYNGSKIWVKIDKNKNTGIINEPEMIEYLKSKGYKIMKPVNEWVEC